MNPKPKSPLTKKPVRAKRMWDNPIRNKPSDVLHNFTTRKNYTDDVPVLVLPGDKESVEHMVEQGAKTIFECSYSKRNLTPKILLRIRGPVPTWAQLTSEAPQNTVVTNCRAKSAALLRSLGIHPLK